MRVPTHAYQSMCASNIQPEMGCHVIAPLDCLLIGAGFAHRGGRTTEAARQRAPALGSLLPLLPAGCTRAGIIPSWSPGHQAHHA